MARYRIFTDATIHRQDQPYGQGHGQVCAEVVQATRHKPAEVEVPDDYVPSLQWEPLDDAARAALDARKDQKRQEYSRIAHGPLAVVLDPR